MDPKNSLAVFQDAKIRKVWHENEWWFVIEDVVVALTGSLNPSGYLKDMRRRDDELSKGWGQFATPLAVSTAGGPQKVNCANTEGLFRIIQSIPSPRAEPFKLWLAKVGYERVKEIEDPELAQNRAKSYYEQKGYPKEWIDKRLRGIAIRQELTDEWKERKVTPGNEFALLTNEISKATFGKSVEEYKEFKGLKNQNLRDHMTDWELIFNMLGEKATTDIARARDAQGFIENKNAAKTGGKIAFNARNELEHETKQSIVSKSNFLKLSEKKKIENKKKLK